MLLEDQVKPSRQVLRGPLEQLVAVERAGWQRGGWTVGHPLQRSRPHAQLFGDGPKEIVGGHRNLLCRSAQHHDGLAPSADRPQDFDREGAPGLESRGLGRGRVKAVLPAAGWFAGRTSDPVLQRAAPEDHPRRLGIIRCVPQFGVGRSVGRRQVGRHGGGDQVEPHRLVKFGLAVLLAARRVQADQRVGLVETGCARGSPIGFGVVAQPGA